LTVRRERTEAERRMETALGPELGSDAVEAAGEVARAPAGSIRNRLLLVVAVAIVAAIVGFIVIPPFPPEDPGRPFQYPADAIVANFELPAPHALFDLDPTTPVDAGSIVTWDLTISSSLFSSWLVMAVVILLAAFLASRITMVPGGRQNALEYAYEGLANFATSLGGPRARRYVPVFLAFFLYILFANWSGLLPFFGRTEQLRAPTSDVNMTIGLALVAFSLFHIEGVRALGVRGYFGKFFTLRGGPIGLFVGVLEFFLEFVKPVTLAMRLFGNIYAGEIALGVITALTFVVLPVAMLSLEVLLNFMQALIFSVLTLMFTLIAIEGHHDEHEEHGDAGAEPIGNVAQVEQPAPSH